MKITVKDIASLVNGTVVGDEKLEIIRPNTIEAAEKGDISFLANLQYEDHIYGSKASAILVEEDFNPKHSDHPTLIKVNDIRMKLALLQNHFSTLKESKKKGVSPNSSVQDSVFIPESSFIDDFVVVKEHASIGEKTEIHAQSYIGEAVKIGSNTIIYPGVKVYAGCEIGDNCIIHANVVIGSDGFGFVPKEDGGYDKMQHTGNVVIGNNVEIGANTVVDKATLGSTKIMDGAKLDNLVHVAHNVEIGKNTAIAAQCGMAGSAKILENCMFGGQVGVAGHITIGNGVKVQAQSGISKNVEDGKSIYGSPALDYFSYLRSYNVFKQLPEMAKKLRDVEKRINDESKNN